VHSHLKARGFQKEIVLVALISLDKSLRQLLREDAARVVAVNRKRFKDIVQFTLLSSYDLNNTIMLAITVLT
jgi:hypothetical protein